jgi:hypothetical protein
MTSFYMNSFYMNSLLGIDGNGAPLIINNEEWATLDPQRYRELSEEVKIDQARELLSLVRLSGKFDLSVSDLQMHFMEYDVPVIVCSSLLSMERYLKKNDGASRLQKSRGAIQDQAICCRIRLKGAKDGKASYFPFIVTAQPPPAALKQSSLLSHEMVHLRTTATALYDEPALRLTCHNADIESYCREHFPEVLQYSIASYLEEEWLACAANFDDRGRNELFTQIHIPLTMHRCMVKLDWWLNDEGKPLNISRTGTLIADTLSQCLARLGYHDSNAAGLMDPSYWNRTTLTAFRQAYKLWQKDPGPFGAGV